MCTYRISMLILSAILALPLFAEVADDAIMLAQSGVTEEVIVAWSERQVVSRLTVQDILRMKDGKVPERAIATLLRMHSRQSAPVTTTNTEYVATPSTTYVYTSPDYSTYSYPYYYSSSGYPYYGSYGYWGPSLSFGYYGGYRGYTGYRGYGGYRYGYSGSHGGGHYGGTHYGGGGHYGGGSHGGGSHYGGGSHGGSGRGGGGGRR